MDIKQKHLIILFSTLLKTENNTPGMTGVTNALLEEYYGGLNNLPSQLADALDAVCKDTDMASLTEYFYNLKED